MLERIKVQKLTESVYLLDDAGESTGYLVVGKKKAALIDTMNGHEDVHALARTITDLPIMVINTHGHCDHIFGNIFFEEAYIHPADMAILGEHSHFPEFLEECKEKNLSMPVMKEIHSGEVIDLGELHLEIIAFEGHTSGGLLLLLKEERILFVGDSFNHHVWMQLPESVCIAKWIQNIEQIEYLGEKADRVLHGHATGFDDFALIRNIKKGAQEILDGKTQQDEVYHWFKGEGKSHQIPNDEGIICYVPENVDFPAENG